MSLGDKFRKHGFFGRLIYYPLMAGLIAVSGCNKGDSGPSGPVGGGNGGGNGGHIEDSGRTNNDGELKLEVDGQEFDVHVTSENGDNLEDIVVTGDYFGNNIYGFSFEDFNHTYFSSVQYVDINRTSSIDEANGFRINEELTKLRGREYEKRFHDGDEPYPYDLSQNPNLRFKKTITLDGLHDFYVENNGIFQNIIILEFITHLTGSPKLSFALEAARFRQTFIESLNNSNDLINSAASFLFRGSFEKEAYYMDVYENDLHVLTHQTTTKGNYITLRGRVMDVSNVGINNAFIDITRGPVFKSAYSDDDGKYFLKFLIEGLYSFTASHFGFNNDNKEKHLSFNGYTQPRCNVLDFHLRPQSSLDTLVLQLNPNNCEDSYVYYNSYRGGDPENTNDNYGGEDLINIYHSDYPAGGTNQIKRGFLRFDLPNLPQNSTIVSASFIFEGGGLTPSGGSITEVLKKVNSSWGEYSLTWNNQPSTSNQNYGRITVDRDHFLWTIDFTNLYNEWHNGVSRNYGFAIFLDSETGTQWGYINSSDHPEVNRRPKVKLVYSYEH